MAKIFSVDIMIAATVYVVADDTDSALRAVHAFDQHGGEFRTGTEFIEGLPVSSAHYGDPDFPAISLSPAVTVHANDSYICEVEEIEE